MQLDYNILFVDDEGFDGFMGQLKDNLNTYLKDNGFVLHDFEAKSKNDLDLQLSKGINFDIIFVDNRFDDDECGIEFIEKIRDVKIYADVILCTALSDTDLRNRINVETAIHGFYYIKKGEGLIQHTRDIINFRLNKELDTNVMRGIAMSEVAKFDARIFEILKTDDKYKSLILTKIKEKTEENYKESKKSTANEKIWEKISDPDKSTIYFNSSLRKDIFHAYALKDIDNLKECYNAIKDKYGDDILSKRNILAHQLEPKLSDDGKKQLRKDIIKFREIFDQIQQYFKENDQ